MADISISSVTNAFGKAQEKLSDSPAQVHKKFAAFLQDSIDKVNQSQIEADIMAEKLARGENVDLHEVMIAAQKASITLSAAMEIRNKVVEAYQEVMRMQI